MPLSSFAQGFSRWTLAAAGCALLPLWAQAQPHGELIAWNTIRYYASEEAARRERTSPFFWRQPDPIGELPEAFALTPQWVRRDGRTIMTVDIPAGASLYGLGRAPGGLVREPGHFECASTSPWIMGVREDGTAFGALLDSTWDFSFAIELGDDAGEPSARIRIETGDIDPTLIIFDLASPGELVTAVNGLTGRLEIPPLWALGVQTTVDAGDGAGAVIPWVDAAWIPCDLVTAEGEATCFDTPAADALSDAGQKRLASIRFAIPAVAAGAAADGAGEPVWVQTADDESLEVAGCRIPDLTDAGMREWWSRQIALLAGRDARGIIIRGALLDGVPEQARFAGEAAMSGPGRRAQYEGVLGLLAAQTAWEALEPEKRDQRVMVAMPTAALGAQRWSVHLIDAATDAPAPRMLIGAALNSSLTAQPIVGASLSGPGSMEVAAWERLVSAAGMMPLFHIERIPQTAREREEDGAARVDLLQALARQRTQLLPHLYTLVFHNFFEGEMVMRPLFMEDPTDAALRDIDTAFMLGTNLLVVPQLGEDSFSRRPVFAERFGRWRRLPVGDHDPRLPALYIRPGSIIPLAPEDHHTSDWSLSPLTIMAVLDDDGIATGVLYEDEWDNFGLFRGQTRRLAYRITTEDEIAYVRLISMDGGWGLPQRTLVVRLLMDEGEVRGEGTERGTIRVPLKGTGPD